MTGSDAELLGGCTDLRYFVATGLVTQLGKVKVCSVRGGQKNILFCVNEQRDAQFL